MPTEHILALLIQERDRLNVAIEALQGPLKHRGRPAKTAQHETGLEKPARKKRTFTAAQRKAQGKRMKAFWAAKRKSA